MLKLSLNKKQLNLLFLGAHCDDIEIGCGATILKFKEDFKNNLTIKWIVFTSDKIRIKEAKKSAESFLSGVNKEIIILNYKDGFLPAKWEEIKNYFERIKLKFDPDLIFTHYKNDFHQDHRIINELTWNTYRNHLILEYEIPKYDGDLDRPNFYVPISNSIVEEKNNIIFKSFQSQSKKNWFTPDVLKGIMRLRGMETNQRILFAEAFYSRKIIL